MADQTNWCSNHGCSYFPVTVFISWFWQAFFLVLLPGSLAVGQKFHLSSGLILGVGSFALLLMGLLPARMLRHGVTQGRPARILVWVISIGSQAIMCVLFVLLPGSGVAWRGCVRGMTCGRGRNQYDPEIFFPCLAFTLAAVVSLVLVSTELAFKKDDFLRLVRTRAEPEAIVIEEVIVSSSKTNDDEEADLRCPKCGTNAGCEAYYNNCDNICYMTYCTKCVHEHGLYVRLEEISEKQNPV